MGAIWFTQTGLFGALGDIVGCKGGLVLTLELLLEHLPKEYGEYVGLQPDDSLRIRSEAFDDLARGLLFNLGVLKTRVRLPPALSLHKKFDEPGDERLLSEAVSRYRVFFEEQVRALAGSGIRVIDPTPFVTAMASDRGPRGGLIAASLVIAFAEEVEESPWSQIRRVDWQDRRALNELFDSEKIKGPHGEYFDQRFVEYLERNFDKIDSIHWRQFEGIVAEFLTRNGFRVELGPGRNDDGVDVRAWPEGQGRELPPALLVQCKRQKETISKVVVKALWADVVAEKAQSGLVATTSRLSPGAAKVCEARGYPVVAADRQHIRKWITAMRQPIEGTLLVG
jgi:restriction system protein